MRLLFDENLSFRLAEILKDPFPGSMHIQVLIHQGATDDEIWETAKKEGFIIVSKDNDFRQMSFLRGAPPKVIWLAIGNLGTAEIAETLKNRRTLIEVFSANQDEALLVLEPETRKN